MTDQDQDQAAELDRGGDLDQDQAAELDQDDDRGDLDQAQGELFDRKPDQPYTDPGDRPRRRVNRRNTGGR
jgi:hypothetical protein